jgi:hypothetical protein
MAGQNTQFVSRSVVDGHGGVGGTMADSGGDLAVDNNETSHDENGKILSFCVQVHTHL